MNIQVAIRIRPFNQREQSMKSKLCISMNNEEVKVKDTNGEIVKKFQFDHCFWSHDEFKTDIMGYCKPKDDFSRYVDQKQVYESLGQDILNNFIKGFNCCIIAYGQTGAGKSYSIFGYGANKGIVPILCEDLLSGQTWDKLNQQNAKTTLKVSMLEIYNEKIQDLLSKVEQRPKSGLKIRETQQLGIYVEDLSQFEVKSFQEIDKIIELGNENKTLGSTLMNATSSRAHTIISLFLTQKQILLGQPTTKQSVIHLVDLAGSEKVKKTAAKKDRLKEACSINKSLSELGNVISQLFKKATKKPKLVVSYRNSVLTRILQNSLGGNSKTTMICAISPALDNIEETLSTLRYANQAKAIKCKAIVNESPTDKLIRELTEENKKLKNLLKDLNNGEGNITQANILIKQIEGLSQIISENNDESQISNNKRKSILDLEQTSFLSYEKIQKDQPVLINLNEDPLISEKMCYSMGKYPVIEVGRETQSKTNMRIVINSVGIIQDHAIITYDGKNVTIETHEPDGAFNIFINGQCLDEFEEEINDDFIFKKQLQDKDRLIFGTCTTFLFRMPNNKQSIQKQVLIDGKKVDWEYCQLEKFEIQEYKERLKQLEMIESKKQQIKNREEDLLKKFEEEKLKYEAIIAQKEKEMQAMYEKMQEMMKQSNTENQPNNQQNIQSTVKELKSQENTRRESFMKEINKLKRESKFVDQVKSIGSKMKPIMIKIYHKLKEANTIADELNRRITFVPFVTEKKDISKQSKTIAKVKVINKEQGWYNLWSIEKFEERLQIMKDIVQNYSETGKYIIDENIDPFYDQKDLFLFGKQSFQLAQILEENEIDLNFKIKNDDDENVGNIQMRIEVKNNNDSLQYVILFDQLEIFDIEGFENKNAYFLIRANGEPILHNQKTQIFQLTSSNMPLELELLINHENFDKKLKTFYQTSKMKIQLFTEDSEEIPKLGMLPPPNPNDHLKNDINEIEKPKTFLKNPNLLSKDNKIGRASIFDENRFQSQRLSKNMCCIM